MNKIHSKKANPDHFFKNKGNALSFATAMIALPCYATELPDFTEEDLFIDIPQVVSATHLPQKLTEVPAAVTIIDQQMIQASSAIIIPDLFRLVPGMQVNHVHTNKHAVTYHGMSDDFPNRMEVMINGRSVYIPLLSTVAWESIGITIEDIDYIEVVRGSNAPTHGSNAFMGAINIITKSPISEQGTQIHATGGSLSTRNFSASNAGSIGALQYRLSVGQNQNDGIDFYDDKGKTRFLNFSGSWTPTLSDTVDFDLGVNDGYAYRGEGNADDLIEANFSPRDHEANYQDIRWNHIIDDSQEFQLRYSHQYLHLDTETFSPEELAIWAGASLDLAIFVTNLNNGYAKDNERGKIDMHDIEYLHTWAPNSGSQLVMGAGIRYEKAFSDTLLQDSNDWVEEHKYRLFGNYEYRDYTPWVFNAGFMLEGGSIADNEISSRIAANYQLDPYSSLRLAYTSAFRTPSLLDANSAFTLDYGAALDIFTKPNPDISAEKISSLEIGYIKYWPDLSSQLDIRLFYEDITDSITSFAIIDNTDTDHFDGIYKINNNTASWITQGFEFQYKLSPQVDLSPNLVLNYSYNNAAGVRDRGFAWKNNEKTIFTLHDLDSLDDRAPLHTASMLLSIKPTEQSLISFNHYYVSHTEWLEGYAQNKSGDTAYNRSDLVLRNNFRLGGGDEIELSLIIQNLFDDRYADFYSNNYFDRRSYLKLSFNL